MFNGFVICSARLGLQSSGCLCTVRAAFEGYYKSSFFLILERIVTLHRA